MEARGEAAGSALTAAPLCPSATVVCLGGGGGGEKYRSLTLSVAPVAAVSVSGVLEPLVELVLEPSFEPTLLGFGLDFNTRSTRLSLPLCCSATFCSRKQSPTNYSTGLARGDAIAQRR